MRTTRFAIYWILLVVTTLSIGAVAFLSLRREGETIQGHAEEARKVAVGYREMAKYSQQMADYAEERADYAMASRARTIADNIHLLMTELKDGLMQSLQSFPDNGIAHELKRWKDENDFVDEVYLWQGDGSSQLTGKKASASPKPENNPLFCRGKSWVWETSDQSGPTFDQSKILALSVPQNAKNETFDLDANKGQETRKEKEPISQTAPVFRPVSPQSSQVFPNAQAPDPAVDAIEQLALPQENASGQMLSVKLEKQQKEIGQQFQSLPKNKSWSGSTYLADNYRGNQDARKQLRDVVQNDVLANIQKQRADVASQEGVLEVESAEGWEYFNGSLEGSQKRLWGCWFRPGSTETRGLQIDTDQLEKNLRAAFPENVDQDEYFVLVDEEGVEVCSVGEVSMEGTDVSRVVLEVGEELPGWNLSAIRRKPPSITLPEVELAEGGSLALAGEGWSGYVVISSIMAAILVGSTLLGGSLLLVQVRRNSLEAVRKTTFVSNVSHELKTPLTTIRMYGEMLGDGLVKDESKRRNYLSTIIAESQRLTRLVNNVLDFSRLEHGEKKYNLEHVDLAECLKAVLAAQRPRLIGEGLEVEWVAPDGEFLAEVDRDALEQVFLNLVDNVVKYAAEGKLIGVQITSNHDEVAFEVVDHGPGIPSEQRERVFETFHRVDDSLTASQPGCGLGLGIARKLVEGMGGAISCEQNKPRGTRFRVVFPRGSKA